MDKERKKHTLEFAVVVDCGGHADVGTQCRVGMAVGL
jgi:hypothetical protein